MRITIVLRFLSLGLLLRRTTLTLRPRLLKMRGAGTQISWSRIGGSFPSKTLHPLSKKLTTYFEMRMETIRDRLVGPAMNNRNLHAVQSEQYSFTNSLYLFKGSTRSSSSTQSNSPTRRRKVERKLCVRTNIRIELRV